MFFRFRVPAGSSRINQQTRFQDSTPLRLKWDNDPSDPVLWTFDAAMDGDYKQQVDQAILRDTWYNLWVVIDNANGLYRLYIQGDAFATQTLVTSANLDNTNTDSHPFNPALIENLVFKGWNNAPVLYDDFYLAHGGENLSNPVEVIPSGGTFSSWIDGYPELSEAEKDPLANPAGDGIGNLLKYAFGLDPRDSAAGIRASATTPGLPVHYVTDSGSSNRVMALRYRRDSSLSDVVYTPQWSSDLGAGGWQANLLEENIISTDGNVEWVQVTFTGAQIPERLFMRIAILRQP